MTSFTREEIQTSISKIYHELEENRLRTNYFIVIGGASLVLQDLIEHTKDVDISTVFTNGPNDFSSIFERLGYKFEFTNKGGRLPLGLKFCHHNIPYSIGYVGLYYLVEPPLIYKMVKADGVEIPVRPGEFIKKDYKELIRINKDSIKTNKMKERCRFL